MSANFKDEKKKYFVLFLRAKKQNCKSKFSIFASANNAEREMGLDFEGIFLEEKIIQISRMFFAFDRCGILEKTVTFFANPFAKTVIE